MLVGGEGIYSKVAKQVSGGRLKTYDTGARGIHGQAPTTAFKELGEGVWRVVDDTRAEGGWPRIEHFCEGRPIADNRSVHALANGRATMNRKSVYHNERQTKRYG